MTYPQNEGMDTYGNLSGDAYDANATLVHWTDILRQIANTAGTTTVLTTTPLVIDATYTGATIDRTTVSPIPIYAYAYSYSDRASATLGFLIEESDNSDMSSASTVVSGTASAATFTTLASTALTKRYFRVKYTNAHANPQITFLLVIGYNSTVIGDVALAATDPGLVALATALTEVKDQYSDFIAVRQVVPATSTQVGVDKSLTWANSAPVNTPQFITSFAQITVPKRTYDVVVLNPSTVTDLTVNIYTKESINSAQAGAFVANFTVTKSPDLSNPWDQSGHVSAKRVQVELSMPTGYVGFSASNNTVLGASDGFTAYLQLWEHQ